MNHTRPVIYLFLLIIALSFSGCGYHFRADGEAVGIEIKSIAIPLIKSSSSERGFEADFTSVLRNEFLSHARIPLKDKKDAAMVLHGSIHEILTEPLTYDSTRTEISGTVVTHETTSSRRLTIRLNISLVDRKNGKTVWQDNSMEEDASFTVTTDPLVTRNNRKKALLKIAKRLSERIYNRTVERF